MPAPFGNQNAKGIDWSGRPRVHDRKKIAEELIEWSLKPESMKFTQFAGPRLINLQRFPEWAQEDIEFAEAYAIAKQNLDVNRFNAMNAEILNPTTYNKSEGLYDPVFGKWERDKSTFEASLRKEQESKPTQINVKVSHDGLGSGIKVSTEELSNSNHKGSK